MKLTYHAKQCFALFLFVTMAVVAQDRSIQGTVTDDAGIPLPGATVVILETNQGTTTDFDGNYSINASDGQTLSISFVGYSTQEITVSENSDFNTALQQDLLEEVVVTALGIKREKRELTYATQTVDSKGIDETRASGNFVNSLQGKVAGISITTVSNGVDGGSKVLLRGNRSIAGSSQPLYVIDGVPLGTDIGNLSPDDIESISVLRGSNAAALYGARANNGAIIITTKSGKEGTFNIFINSTATFETANILFDYQNDYGQGSGGEYTSFSTDSWGPKLGGSKPHWSASEDISGNIPFEANPNNITDFFDTGVSLANNISISTGGENSRTYFGYTNDTRTGIVPGNKLSRHNLNLKIDNDLLEGKLKLSARINYIKSLVDNSLSTGESFSNPLRHVYRLPRNIRTQDAQVFEYVDREGSLKQNYWKPKDNGGANPYWTINRNLKEDVSNRMIGYTSLTYSINESIDLMVRSSIDNLTFFRETRDYNDSYIIADNGNYRTSNRSSLEWNNDFLLTYAEAFGELDFKLSLGGNNRIFRFKNFSTNNGGLNAPNIFSVANAQNLTSAQNISEKNVNSLYAFSNLGYKNALYFDLTYRSDWSSTLPVENNRYDYTSAGLSAVFSEMIELPEFMSYLKARVSYAEVGNDTSSYRLTRDADLEPGAHVKLQSVGTASNLKPERTKSFEAGFETTLMNQALTLDFTYYKSNSINQLFEQDVPVASGISKKFVNGADIQNSGIEAVVNISLFRSQDFSWDMTLNYAANKSKILKIADSQKELDYGGGFFYSYRLEEGQPWGNIYSRGFERDDEGRVEMNNNGTPKITLGQTVKIGNYNPDWLGGIRNSFNYKNFNLSFLIDIRQGGEVGSFTKTILASDGLLKETTIGRGGTIVFGQDVYQHEIPASTPTPVDPETFWTSIGGRNSPVGEAFIEDASNIRLRELSFGYDFPQQTLINTPFKSVKLSFVGRNLFFLSNSASVDPEAIVGTGLNADGFEAFSLPLTRSLGFNLKLGF